MSDRPDHVAAVFIAAPPERVWRALTDPAEQALFFGGPTELGDVGERFVRSATDVYPEITGRVLARAAPKHLAITWGFASDPPPDRVEFSLEPAGAATRLTLSYFQGRDWGDAARDAGVFGWALLLSGLKTLIETGQPLNLEP